MATQKITLNELRSAIRQIIKEEINPKLYINKYKSDNGNKQIGLKIGEGISGKELLLSVEEAKILQKLAKDFTSNRKEVSATANTNDKNKTQSIIKIKPDGNYSMTIYRIEGSTTKSYESESGMPGILDAPQSIAYTLVDELGKYIS